jgi:hypothetical protein
LKRAARIDGNHGEVVKALEAAGMTVQSLAAVGAGVPDLLVGWRGVNVLLEVKDGSLAPSARELTAAQREWHATWGGQVHAVTSPQQAVDVVLHVHAITVAP